VSSTGILGEFGRCSGLGLAGLVGLVAMGVGLAGVLGLKRAPDKQKRAPWRVSAIHEFQLFGLYSLSEETNPYRMGTLVPDVQTHVQGIFMR
jgi:hypothetical protein